MKPIEEFLSDLRQTGIKLWAEGDRLRYQAPPDTLTPALLQDLKARKAEILAFLHRLDTAPETDLPPILPAPRDRDIPLSFAQESLWFLDRLMPNSPLYNIPVAYRIAGELNIPALEQSFAEMIRRHEILRTTFSTADKQPIQTISPEGDFHLPVIDLGAIPETEREAKGQQWMNQEAQQPFDLARGPLVRVKLLQFEETDYILSIVLHHIVSDGWSLDVLMQELAVLYSGYATGKPASLPELPIQYADFTLGQREWFSGAGLEAQLAYWKQQLAGKLPVLALPSDRPRPPVQSDRGAILSFELSRDLTEELKALSRREGVTLFMTLLAAFDVLLYRYTGQEDILVGSPIANRNRPELEGLIGFLVNTLVLRSDLKGNPRFRELLERVRGVALGAYDNPDLPFERLVEELHPERNPSHNPLFQVMFALQNAPESDRKIADLVLSPLEVENQTAKFDLTLDMRESEQGLRGVFEYNRDLWDEERIARMVCHWQTLLAGIVTDPEQRIGELPILTEVEKRQLLVEWNQTQREYRAEKCVHQWFEEQVERNPDRVAVQFKEQQLTYQELNARANRLAHYLQTQGVESEVLVGICLERSPDAIVGLLGILKAGGAYVPIDPAYPSDRITYILQDTGMSLVLSQESLAAKLPQAETVSYLYLDRDWDGISEYSAENPSNRVEGHNLAYVIYTSGSTGQPKGVEIEHRSLASFTQSAIAIYEIEASDRILQFASLSFDTAVEEIYPCLCTGATLVLRTEDAIASSARFWHCCQDWGLTVLNIPTAYWHLLASDLTPETPLPTDVRLVITGGEQALPGFWQQWQQWLAAKASSDSPKVPKFVNTYGPTETTVSATFYYFPDLGDTASSSSPDIPIGRPFGQGRIYLLDAHQQLVPIGVPGELHIGGEGLARGYLNRPQLTEEKFIPNPFGNSKLYKTGDLARYRPDGNLEFLGRIDHQVKIRGFRIELGEIEAILSQHSTVEQTVAIAREDTPGNKQLVAYLVPNDRSPNNSSDIPNQLRSFLKEKLPDYMIPSAFVLLETLPLTPNGKVDRGALPSPDRIRPGVEETFVASRTPIEEVLVGIWMAVLNSDRVGVQDNFFELGGHSLLATQVIARVRDALDVDLSLYHLFEAPTIADLAEKIEAMRREGSRIATLPLLPRRSKDKIPLSFAQQRLWFLDRLMPNSPLYNMSLAYRIAGEVNVAALEQSFAEIIRRHESLRTTFSTADGQPIQAISPEMDFRLPVIDLGPIPNKEREAKGQQWINQEAQQPFDLTRGPLVRVKLLQFEETDSILSLILHHIVSDGWSLDVLMQELAVLYSGYATGKPASLPELPIQYADFTLGQQEWFSGTGLEAQLAYWKQQLAGKLPVLALPSDRPRPPVQTTRGATLSFELSQDLTEALKALSRREGVTLFMTLLAAFKVLLYRYTGQEDILVGSPIANRNRPEIEGLIGFLINTVVLRSDLKGNPRFRELLGRVRGVALGAYDNPDLPFERLVEELHPERDPSHNPLFQVMFALQNAPESDRKIANLVLSPLEVENQTAKFDLTLEMVESEQELRGRFEYNCDLLDEDLVAQMVGHWQTLLAEIVANPEGRIGELPILTEAEGHQLLVEWNQTQREYRAEKCVHQLFEEQVERTPDRVAVEFAGKHLTYRELNEEANRLAHYLRKQGAGPEVLVGICLERSLEMIVGLLGILKAGSAYVPLDPIYPRERLAFMVEDAGVSLLLTQQELVGILPETGTQFIGLDAGVDGEKIAREVAENPDSGVKPANLAYVIYTSGSTGKPKGVQIGHQSLVNFLCSMAETPGLTETDVILAVTTICFDIAGLEMYLPLIVGAKIVLASREVAANGKRLLEKLMNSGITTMQATPATWQMLLAAGWQGSPQLNILCGGEALSGQLAARLRERGASLWNLYGPTETTIWSTVCPVENSGEMDSRPDASVSIGKAIANTQIYILDRYLQPVPPGVSGELHIGGDGLARGYLNRPQLTAEKFIANPFINSKFNRLVGYAECDSASPNLKIQNSKFGIQNSKLYKTGDLARYRTDGTLEFFGRIDHQVKIRGFRIELGEIEALLSEDPAIKQAVVIGREDTPGNKRLVAYLIPQDLSSLQNLQNQLRDALKQKLPDYMIPAAFVFLKDFPLTPNGKVDRRALPAPDSTRQEPEKTFVAPRDDLEQQLTQIWERVLAIHPIGIQDDFFDIGGHSLLAIELFAQIEKIFKIELPLDIIFKARTIEEQAELLRREDYISKWTNLIAYLSLSLSPSSLALRRIAMQLFLVNYWSSVVAIKPKGSKPPLFCVSGFGGNVLFYNNIIKYLDSEQPVYGLQSVGVDGKQDPLNRMEDIAARYIQDIQTLQPQGPYFLGGFSLGTHVVWEIARQLCAKGQKVALLALFDNGPSYFQGKRKSFPKRLLIHLQNLVREGPTYITQRIPIWSQWLGGRLSAPVKKASINVLNGLDKPLPFKLNQFVIEERLARAGSEAIHNYVLQSFSGDAILFRSTVDQVGYRECFDLGWEELVVGTLEIYEVPGDHLSIFKEPNVGVLAEQLQVCLDNAIAKTQNS